MSIDFALALVLPVQLSSTRRSVNMSDSQKHGQSGGCRAKHEFNSCCGRSSAKTDKPVPKSSNDDKGCGGNKPHNKP